MQEIKFDYLPEESPTEHGWVLTEGQGEVQLLPGEDSHHGPFMRIKAEQDFCMDFGASQQACKAVEFIVRPGPNFAFYAIVKVRNQHQKMSPDDEVRLYCSFTKGIYPDPEQHPEYPNEYKVYVPVDWLENDWIRVKIELPQKVWEAAVNGNEEWEFDRLSMLRFKGSRGETDIASILLHEESPWRSTLSLRRPGYDHVDQLAQQYREIPPEKRAQMNEGEVIDFYIMPMFGALGWSVGGGGHAVQNKGIPSFQLIDLVLEYRDLRVPVEVKKFGGPLSPEANNQLLRLAQDMDSSWGILTNFEIIRIWDVKRSSLILETSPWSYVADDREEDDLLAAQIFYERLVQPPSEELPSERIEIATRALADTWSKVDLLEFSDYAEALADFIKNEKTGKPLTIGIDAAWGMGKTTLMHIIKDQLVQQEEKTKGKGSFPTVWFNAWRYDQEESLWAALALEILSQVRERFNWLQRIEFWFQLNRERLDRELLLRSGLKLLAYLLTIILLGVLVFGIATLWLGTTLLESIQRLWAYITVTGALGFFGALYAVGKEAYSRLIGPFDLKIAQYVREPNYKERVGFLAEFEEDFRRVIDVVTEKGKWPLVVFIDDLDRCAPPKPAEIIEAVNILLDAEHCVFVIGMDARTVAGSIEAKYKDLKGYLDDVDDPGGLTLGQRFLEKIVQISFHIPRADPKVVNSFINANLKALREKPPEELPREEIKEAEQLIEVEQKAGKALDEAAQAVQAARPDIPMEVVAKAKEEVFAKSFDDSEDVQRAIHDAAPYLGFNPRKIKRFINIFRLHALIANRRGLLETGVTPLDLLAKCVIIAMRCPDMVEEIMTDQGFVNRLKQARQIKDRLLKSEYGPEQEQRDRTSLGNLLTDPRIERLIDATDLIALLEDMTTEEIETLPYCLHLVEITSNGRGEVN